MLRSRYLIFALLGTVIAGLYFLDTRRLVAQSRLDQISDALSNGQISAARVLFCSQGMSHRNGVQLDDLLRLSRDQKNETASDGLCAVRDIASIQSSADVESKKTLVNLASHMRATLVFPFGFYQYEPKLVVLLYGRSEHEIFAVYFYSGGMGGGIGRVADDHGLLHSQDIVPVIFSGTSLYKYITSRI